MSAGAHWWIYESWTHDRAIVHRADCSYCNDGRGRQSKGSGKNGHWLGPLKNSEEAWRKAQSLGRATTTFCSQCRALLSASEPTRGFSRELAERPREFEHDLARAPGLRPANLKPMIQTASESHDGKSPFERLYGCLKGTVKVAPGVDLTAPAWDREEWEAWEAKWDRLAPRKDPRA